MSLIGVIIVVLDLLLQSVSRSSNAGLLNRGVSFGLAPEIGPAISLVVFGIFVCIYIFRPACRQAGPVINGGVTLIILGGVGNILSRLVWGSVWDYICLPFLPFCFNLSDVLISLGVVSYILGVNGNRSTLRGQRDTGN